MADEEEARSDFWEFYRNTHNAPRANILNMADNVLGLKFQDCRTYSEDTRSQML